MIGKIEKKIIHIKNKINKKVMSIIIFGVFGALIIFALNMTNSYKRQKQITQDAYNKALYEMVGYINNAQVELAKIKVISTNNLKITTLSGIWRYSNLAKENLNILPLEQNNIANVSKFLSQMSDFSYSLMVNLAKQISITQEQEEKLNLLYDNCKKLSDTMEEIYSDLNNGRIVWNELQYIGNEKLNNENLDTNSITSIDTLGKDFEEYEGLIYDGAFSEHILNFTPKNLSDNELSYEEAMEEFKNKFKGQIENIEFTYESSGKIDLYNYDVKFKDYDNTRKLSLTKKDGKIYLMVSDRNVNEEKISMNDAKSIGLEFLKKLGIEDVIDTYYLKDSNMAIINYAAIQDNIILYPDLVKVKIALDTGEVCSVETQGYIFNHVKRVDMGEISSIDEARNIIKSKEYIISEKLAIIPTDYKEEVLVYEFKGKIDDTEFLIYINANTLVEEKVLLILNTPGGVLTI